jgi:Hypervirulence associated proteins TUDOR domain
MAESQKFKQGDKVSWNTSQGKTHGKVVKKLTSDTHVKGTKITASESEPRYLVESEKTGEEAAHKPDALEKRS